MASPPATSPRFSIVSAVYNVDPYLPEYIAAIEAQRVGRGELEVIAVDDGSTDGSLDILRRWAATSRHTVHVFTKPNGGQASARNLGMDHATGEWVTFTDPDDKLDRNFLRAAGTFAAAHPEIEVMSGRTIWLREERGRLVDAHHRRFQYRRGNRVVDLEEEPSVSNGSTNVSLFRLDRIRAMGLRFDPRIRPNFEDGHFSCCYVLGLDRPLVGIVADARYIYRLRASRDSTLQTSLAHPGHYTDVLEHGYLDVIARAQARFGRVPEWLQHVLIYELSWYISADEKSTSDVRLADELVPRFHELFGRITQSLDPAVVARHQTRALNAIWEHILSHAYRDEPWHTPVVIRTKVDREMRLQRVHYRFVGPRPLETFTLDGQPVTPAYEKQRTHRYYWRSLVEERILWFPAGAGLRAQLNGTAVPIGPHWRPGYVVARERRSWGDRLWIYVRVPPRMIAAGAWRRVRGLVVRLTAPAMRALSSLPIYRRPFEGAWVLMDRINNADDNGERLFEYLRARRPDVNAWFVVAADSPDWRRLKRARTERLVAYGSFRWKMLMLHSHWLISSHADLAVAEPPAVTRISGRPTWKYAFLNHGVIKDDLSLWLNHRDMDLFIVSTIGELGSVADDGSCYVVTHKETRNTGLARFDRLREKGREVAHEDRQLVLIAPTWRTSLSLRIDPDRQTRDVDPGFRDSDYYRNWDAIIRSEEIAAAARRRGWRVGFMPHPNMQPILSVLDLPAHVDPLTFDDNDVQALYARCALMVTDYSSVAFNTAYLDRPLVYFQFDFDEVMSGGHIGRKGYFDYERDGFGPVARTPADAIRAIVAAIDAGADPTPEYQARIDRTFPVRDGGDCERTVAALEELSRPYETPAG